MNPETEPTEDKVYRLGTPEEESGGKTAKELGEEAAEAVRRHTEEEKIDEN